MIGSSSLMAVLGSPLFTASSTFFHWSVRLGGVNGFAATRTTTPAMVHRATDPRTIRREWRDMGEPPEEGTREADPAVRRGRDILLDVRGGLFLVTGRFPGPSRGQAA